MTRPALRSADLSFAFSPGQLKNHALRVLRSAAHEALALLPLSAWKWAFPRDGIGICYHVVSDRRLAHVKHYPVLNIKQFEDDLAYLRRRFTFVSYDQLTGGLPRDTVRGRRPLVLTVDDGFAECATIIQPLLIRENVSCIFFVVTDFIDNQVMFRETKASLCIDAIGRLPPQVTIDIVGELGLAARLPADEPAPSDGSAFGVADLGFTPDATLVPILRWLLHVDVADTDLLDRLCCRLHVDIPAYLRDTQPFLSAAQIRQLKAEGFVIGAHSCTHQLLQTLSRAEAEREIVESCRVIRDLTGQASVPFAFPYTGAKLDRNWLADLRERHDFIGLYFSTEGPVRDAPSVVQRVFGERFDGSPSLDVMLRRAWARPSAWHMEDSGSFLKKRRKRL